MLQMREHFLLMNMVKFMFLMMVEKWIWIWGTMKDS